MALLNDVAVEDVTSQFESIEALNYAVCTLTADISGQSTTINVAVCRECSYVVLADTLVNHLVSNNKHRLVRRDINNVAKAAIDVLARFLSSETKIVEFQDAIRSKNVSQIPHLALQTGWQCSLCLRVYKTKDSLSTHRGRCPEDSRPVGQRSHPKLRPSDEIHCQCFFSARNRSFFKVQAIEGPQPTISVESKLVTKILEERLNVSDNVTEFQTPVSWLERTGWLQFCGGSKESVIEICKLARLDVGKEPHMDIIEKSARRLLNSSLQYIDKTGVQVLCKLRSPDETDDGRPFTRKLSESALEDYFNIMVRMIVYLCRVVQSDALAVKCRVVFPRDVKRAFLAIVEASRPEEPAEPGVPAVPATLQEPDIEVLMVMILNAVIDCMKTSIPITTVSRFDHPVMNYLATQGWDEKGKSWRAAEFSTKTFAGMSYCTRLLVLRYSWEKAKLQTDEDDTGALNFAIREELDKLLPITKQHQGYPMSEWLSQHAYGKAVTDHSSRVGKLHRNKENTGIYYKGELLLIEKYREYIMSFCPKLNELMDQQMFETATNRTRISPSQVFDDPSNTSRGYYFGQDSKNFEFFRPSRLIETIETNPELRAKFYPSAGVLSQAASNQYLEQDIEIRKMFAIAALLIAGEPPRGTELSTLRKYNTGVNSRNFYIIDGDVMLLGSYIKTQAKTGFSKGVARFFPDDIGELFVTYMLIVDPFCDYLRSKRGMKLTSYMFAGPDGIPWGTNVYSEYLITHVQAATGFPLKISSYRQIIAAITRAYVDPMSQLIEKRVEEEENVAAEQFGHGRRTNLSRYSRDSNRFIHMDEVTMDLYRRATAFFQFYIGAIPRLPQWLIEPSKIYFAIGQQPRFGHAAYPPGFQMESISNVSRPAVSVMPRAARATATLPAPPVPPVEDSVPVTALVGGSAVYSTVQEDGTRSLVKWKLPEQAQAAEAIYKRSVSPLLVTLACAAGKTTAALLAIKAGTGISIIVEPFISTCDDVAARAAGMGIHVTYWVSEVAGLDDQMQPVYRMRVPSHIDTRAPGVIIATPEAAISPNFLEEALKLNNQRRLDRIIVDEIHQPILDEGFRDVAALSKLTNLGLQLVCMSATTPPLLIGPICNFFHVSSFQEIRSTTNVPNMQYKVMMVQNFIDQAVAYISALRAKFATLGVLPQKNKILAFCRSRDQARMLSMRLSGYEYNGKMELDARKETLEKWNGGGGVMCATTAFGPGVDAKDVVAVIHVGCPYTLVDLIQQSSRAGRDGSPAVNTVICRPPSYRDANYKNRQLWRREAYKALDLYLTTNECRRWVISSFMDGNHKAVDCVMGGMSLCDNCDIERDPDYTAAAIANRSGIPGVRVHDLPRLDQNAARAAQNASIVAFIKSARADCAYCRFTLGCDSGHHIDNCPVFEPQEFSAKWESSVCVNCGLLTRVCIQASNNESCKSHVVCKALYTAVFADPDIRTHVFGELGIRGLELKDWYTYGRRLTEVELREEVGYSNAWKLVQTLEELNYLL